MTRVNEDNREISIGHIADLRAFNGLYLVIVQATRKAGTIELVAAADGLEAAKIVIRYNEAEPRPALD